MKKILLLSFCAVSMVAQAQQKVTLMDAINAALKNSYDIQLAKNDLEISDINNNIGVAGGLPLVTATANDNEQVTTINQKFADATRDTQRPNVGSNNLTLGVTGSILLYNGYRVITTKKRLEELEKQNQQLLDVQIQNSIAAVVTKYYDVVRQQGYQKTILQTIAVSQQKLDVFQARKEAGLANNADIFQAQLDLNASLQLQQSQQLVIDQAKTDLLNLMFVSPDSAITVNDTIIVDKNIRLETVLSALPANPQVLSANQQIRINELIEKETGALRYPSVRASTGFNLSNNRSAAGFSLLNQSYGPFVALNITIPIYNGGVFKRQQQVAEVNTRSAHILKDNISLDLETSAVRSYQAYTNTLNQLQTQQENYRLAQQLLDLVLQRLQLGQTTIIEVKVAQQSFEDAGYRLVNLNYAAKVAEIELKRLASQLGK